MNIRPSTGPRTEQPQRLLGSRARQQGVQAERRADSPPRPETPAPKNTPTGRLSVIEKPDQRPTSARTKALPQRQRAVTTLGPKTARSESPSTRQDSPKLRGTRGEDSPSKSATPKAVGFDENLYRPRTDIGTGKMTFVRTRQTISSGDRTPQTESFAAGDKGSLPPIPRPQRHGAMERSSVWSRREARHELPKAPTLGDVLGPIVRAVKGKPRLAPEKILGAKQRPVPSQAQAPTSSLFVMVDPYTDEEYSSYLEEEVSYSSESADSERRDAMPGLPQFSEQSVSVQSTSSEDNDKIDIEEVVIERVKVVDLTSQAKSDT